MPQEALPPSLAALLAREDFADDVFESGRCAHSVGEKKPIFELVLDRLLAALDGDATASPRGGASGFLHENHHYGHPARAASYRQGLDFQLGRVNEKAGGTGSTSGNISTRTCPTARRPGARSKTATR